MKSKKNNYLIKIFTKMQLPIILVILSIIILFLKGIAEIGQINAVQTLLDAMQKGDFLVEKGIAQAIGFLVLETIMGGIAGVLTGWIGYHGIYCLRLAIAHKLTRCSIMPITAMGTGEIQSRLQEDLNSSAQFVLTFTSGILYGILILILALTITFFSSWQMTLVCVLMVFAVLTVSSKSSKRLGNCTEEVRTASGELSQKITEYIWQIPITKALSAEEEWYKQISAGTEKLLEARLKQTNAETGYQPIVTLTQFLPQMIILFLGGYLILKQQITMGNLMMFIMLFGYIAQGIASIPSWISSYRSAFVSAKRTEELFDFPDVSGKFQNLNLEDREQIPVIELSGLTYSYNELEADEKEEQRTAFSLSNINLHAEKGQHIAIAGESGCGKSTLLKILCGLQKPDSGKGTVMGYDLALCHSEQITKNIAIMLQDSFLFPGTLRENLRLGNTSASDEEILSACEKSKIKEWIKEQPNGLDTVITEFSSNISGGQKQRFGLARAVLRNAPLWILDEPFASLDPQTSSQIQQSLKEITKDQTVIMVSHQLWQIIDFDLILYMKNGKIIEEGTHESLMRFNGEYARMFREQNNGEKNNKIEKGKENESTV